MDSHKNTSVTSRCSQLLLLVKRLKAGLRETVASSSAYH